MIAIPRSERGLTDRLCVTLSTPRRPAVTCTGRVLGVCPTFYPSRLLMAECKEYFRAGVSRHARIFKLDPLL